METEELYETVLEAVRQALAERAEGDPVAISRRMARGLVLFRDDEGRTMKEMEAAVFFKKVTAIREKLRVLEQKLNNHPALPAEDRAELQGYVTRCYGTLTTFNFLFRDEEDKFKGTGD
jgi:hypothetical protein